MTNWKFGDVLEKAANPTDRAVFVCWDRGAFWIVMLYKGTYEFGETVHWVIGPSAWVAVDD